MIKLGYQRPQRWSDDGACRALYYTRRVCLVDDQLEKLARGADLIHGNEHRVEDCGGAIPAIHTFCD